MADEKGMMTNLPRKMSFRKFFLIVLFVAQIPNDLGKKVQIIQGIDYSETSL